MPDNYDALRDALKRHAEEVRAFVEEMQKRSDWCAEIVASSRCVNCGKPILKQRKGFLNDGWLHPVEIDKPRGEQRWARFCYQPPEAEPEPGWNL